MAGTYQQIENAIARIRPLLQSDGGDIEIVELEGTTVRVRLTGACAGCPTAHMTLYTGVEGLLRRLDPGLRVELAS
jgi:Fe-S cluster biogenesis protein NfuA